MPRAIHYAVTSYLLGEYEPEEVAVCGNDFSRSKKLTDDVREVTCATCLTLMGYEPVPVEQLTHVEPEPIRRAA
jgi:hypothetical protein